ncbi:ketoacyl-ACP synthase III [Rickettsia prowazekii]|uniref:Beta-ketoacyl-[acyl-carrier-protein] synthase III n=1 Tax=Rickettsia prowazekii (strain Madrid E) TaxID=272947 RepID=FABH_RICPR|nr:ketoacyl-ACP synthase III [Rickettsia prowazekii]Q9ZCH1.1 RecName: Full=Beta-ketoacyl-[acyl-carrier-protein] synthase III; Short=Beta-ketoacyl-ACP synthase III; Short=KAS III; AltName: Full=3-oxoacyl-[acyl-carrier-protein] synthase 3; AltName: Full=3-oxoacyl-[acyl-carrier-protein] synthase III [Rickettsia prowazekii str. Madrid E]AFE50412.1 3-oxoacyl-(acyl carrier protein) synthase III [Rickettsia prowazekii str. Katsinyian]AGJ01563.1 3-oxoacyl-[acyl-carrier-protein] synthase 3 [Rickettsia pr
MTCKIIGSGGYLPPKIISNDELTKFVDTNDKWIRTRTGILQRHIAGDAEYTSHLAFKSAQKAIEDAMISVDDIDLIIICTTTPDNSFPSVATKLHGYLGLTNIPSFDLQAVCAGFIYGLQLAHSLIVSGKYKTILLIGAEKMTSLLDWNDRSTCVLFGDGAGSVILQRSNDDSGLIDSNIFSSGTDYEILYTSGGTSMNGTSGKIVMQGQKLFRHAIEKMLQSIEDLLYANQFSVSDIDYFIPHQANIRIINKLAELLNIEEHKVVKTVEKHANCSAASIPLALSALKESGKIKKGDILLFSAIGAGLTWGGALIRW